MSSNFVTFLCVSKCFNVCNPRNSTSVIGFPPYLMQCHCVNICKVLPSEKGYLYSFVILINKSYVDLYYYGRALYLANLDI